MLKSLSIDNLFNLYSYNIDFRNDNSDIHFLTGPNGYGKTTILNIIDAIYSGNNDFLATIPFKSLQLDFTDDYILRVIRHVDYLEDEESDEKTIANISLTFDFKHTSDGKNLYHSKVNGADSKEDENESLPNVVNLYFESHAVYYVRDGRLYSKEGIPTIEQCISKMKNLLQNKDYFENDLNIKRLDIFKNIISNAGFADKDLQIDGRYGFRFVSRSAERNIIYSSRLSSGEQHMVVMAFHLLFEAPDDSLVLIDEPEISFHMIWQVDFLKNLRDIAALRKLQCIVATHSPQIFNMEWSLTTDLFEQINGK